MLVEATWSCSFCGTYHRLLCRDRGSVWEECLSYVGPQAPDSKQYPGEPGRAASAPLPVRIQGSGLQLQEDILHHSQDDGASWAQALGPDSLTFWLPIMLSAPGCFLSFLHRPHL